MLGGFAVLFEGGGVAGVEDLPGAGKGQRIGFDRRPAHGAGFNAATVWLGLGKRGGGPGQFPLGVLPHGGLVVFDAQDIVAALFLGDDLGGFFLAVEWVGGDDAVQQVNDSERSSFWAAGSSWPLLGAANRATGAPSSCLTRLTMQPKWSRMVLPSRAREAGRRRLGFAASGSARRPRRPGPGPGAGHAARYRWGPDRKRVAFLGPEAQQPC